MEYSVQRIRNLNAEKNCMGVFMSKMCRRELITVLFLFFVFLATPAVAESPKDPAEPSMDQTEPSKDQTIVYLLERINDVNLRASTMSIRTESKLIKLNVSHVQNATIKDCVLTIKETKMENEDKVLDKTLTVPIAKLNPSNIKTASNRLIIFTSNDGLDVALDAKYRKDAKGKWTTDSRTVDAINVKFSKGQGEKIARAFSHLITLCGGKKDLF